MSTRTVNLNIGEKENRILRQGEQILKKSLDARSKSNLHWVYTLGHRAENALNVLTCEMKNRPVVVGFGPAGMFAALYLAKAGARPIVIERGSEVLKRKAAVDSFRKGGAFSEINNAQFGEGGAGTFSDGKLNTNTHDGRIAQVLQVFYDHGAKESILYDSKPHIGTDVLIEVVQNIRKDIIALGGEVRFDTKLEKLLIDNGKICGLIANGEEIACENVILCIGHSARDTLEMLNNLGIPMVPKSFSMGVRIEHLQKDINLAQYGRVDGLPAADYKLSHNGVYSFCMCPGGYVFAANSENNTVCTNGMSYSGRAGINSNSALLVTLKPEDFPSDDVLSGIKWQKEIEKKAFLVGGSNYFAVSQTVGDFLENKPSTSFGKVKPTYLPGVIAGDVSEILPEKICSSLREALPVFDTKIKGFASPDAVITAPETRSSSPVRIVRNDSFESEISGLYPCGEGAGYSGGITSSAVDGLRCAESLVKKELLKK